MTAIQRVVTKHYLIQFTTIPSAKRDEPESLEEFVECGIQPEDYTHYVGLQMRVQDELMVYRCILKDTRYPDITEQNFLLPRKELNRA